MPRVAAVSRLLVISQSGPLIVMASAVVVAGTAPNATSEWTRKRPPPVARNFPVNPELSASRRTYLFLDVTRFVMGTISQISVPGPEIGAFTTMPRSLGSTVCNRKLLPLFTVMFPARLKYVPSVAFWMYPPLAIRLGTVIVAPLLPLNPM